MPIATIATGTAITSSTTIAKSAATPKSFNWPLLSDRRPCSRGSRPAPRAAHYFSNGLRLIVTPHAEENGRRYEGHDRKVQPAPRGGSVDGKERDDGGDDPAGGECPSNVTRCHGTPTFTRALMRLTQEGRAGGQASGKRCPPT